MPRKLLGAMSGVLSAAFGVAAGQVLASAAHPAAGPLVAVGSAVIDATPTPVKEFAVRELGTHDKPVLLGTIVVVIAVLTAATGVFALRRGAAVVAGAVVLGVAGAAAALSRPSAVWYDAIPSVVGAVLAGLALRLLIGRLKPAAEGRPVVPERVTVAAGVGPEVVPAPPTVVPAPPRVVAGPPTVEPPAAVPVVVSKRRFLQAALLVSAGAIAAGSAAVTVDRIRGAGVAGSRKAIRLPAPADPGPPVPPGVGAGFVTPDASFYRVDTALTVPAIDVSAWRLRIHGKVGRTAELSFADLLDRPLIERTITLNCVSNEVGGPYIGTARWLGVPLAPLLRELGIQPGADQIVARSVEGMTIGTPVDIAMDGRDTMLCVGMNGEPLPPVHGFPVRMLTPGLYGYAGACKWLTEIELTTFAAYDAYWVKRGWAARGPVKTASRIDAPKAFETPAAGPVTVAGVAWAQRRGIRTVEVRVDDGPWSPAELLPVPSSDTWVQWRYHWTATPGLHTLAVRATDRTGVTQPSTRVPPFPNGATGWHTLTVSVK